MPERSDENPAEDDLPIPDADPRAVDAAKYATEEEPAVAREDRDPDDQDS